MHQYCNLLWHCWIDGSWLAIPIKLAMQVMKAILLSGSVTPGWIAVEPQNIFSRTCSIIEMTRQCQWDTNNTSSWGLHRRLRRHKASGILTKVNSNRIKNVRQLLNQIAQISPSNSAVIEILLRGKELEVKAPFGKWPKPKPKILDV